MKYKLKLKYISTFMIETRSRRFLINNKFSIMQKNLFIKT